MNTVLMIKVLVGPERRAKTFHGRVAATLDMLLRAGNTGITSFDNPGPRLSDYVHKLRKAGLVIETVYEKHAGPYPGEHGRYVLRSAVIRVDEVHYGHQFADA